MDKNSEAVIEGTKEFKKLVLERDLNGCTKVNEVDLSELEKTAFSKTLDQTITGNFKLQELYTGGWLNLSFLR